MVFEFKRRSALGYDRVLDEFEKAITFRTANPITIPGLTSFQKVAQLPITPVIDVSDYVERSGQNPLRSIRSRFWRVRQNAEPAHATFILVSSSDQPYQIKKIWWCNTNDADGNPGVGLTADLCIYKPSVGTGHPFRRIIAQDGSSVGKNWSPGEVLEAGDRLSVLIATQGVNIFRHYIWMQFVPLGDRRRPEVLAPQLDPALGGYNFDALPAAPAIAGSGVTVLYDSWA